MQKCTCCEISCILFMRTWLLTKQKIWGLIEKSWETKHVIYEHMVAKVQGIMWKIGDILGLGAFTGYHHILSSAACYVTVLKESADPVMCCTFQSENLAYKEFPS